MKPPSYLHRCFFLFATLFVRSHAQLGGTTSLANDFIVTNTNVDSHADLALDIRDMRSALKASNFDSAKSIYRDGKHSQRFNRQGEPIRLRTLQRLSTAASSGLFNIEPPFLYHVWGIADGEVNKLGDYARYANDFVNAALNDASSGTLAAEAAVALNVWMYVAHEIFDGLDECRRAENGENLDGLSDNGLGVDAIDEAMAYWVGSEQERGGTDGHSLYQLADDAEVAFGGVRSDSQFVSNTNTRLKTLYDNIRDVLSEEDRCYPHSGTTRKLYHIANKMVSVMMIPLMQKLIESLVSKDINRIKLYALAIVPQISACQPSVASTLMKKLYDNEYDPSDKDEVITMLQGTYSCLGFECYDIGDIGDSTPDCTDPDPDAPMAGYSPSTTVRDLSAIDLDILQIKILTKSGGFLPAKDLYENGKNVKYSDNLFLKKSLQSVAKATDRNMADPYHMYFVQYNRDIDYGDSIVQDALNGNDRYATMSYDQRSEFVVKTLQYQVMFIHAVTKFNEAVGHCERMNEGMSLLSWDEGVANLIGSIEGEKEGGAPLVDGMLLYNLANEMCFFFDTCDDDGTNETAKVSNDLMSLFNKGRKAALAITCPAMQDTVGKIVQLAMIPVMQAVLHEAIENQNMIINSNTKDQAEGEVFARSILPIVKNYEPDAADVIEKNMLMTAGNNTELVSDGVQAVANAIYAVVDEFGHDCDDIGKTDEIEFGYICTAGSGSILANGFAATRSNVDSHANLALDIRAMKVALSNSDFRKAENIYRYGKNSQKFDKLGNPTGFRTLQQFSTAASSGKFDLEPAFWYHLWGITNGDVDQIPTFQTYADQYVTSLLEDTTSGTLAAEAAVALNVWMYVVHELYDALNDCRRAESNEYGIDLDDNGLGVYAIDEAMAFWIGSEQQTTVGTGFLLFELAQQAEVDFGSMDVAMEHGVAKVNTRIREIYERMFMDLAMPDRCHPGSGTTQKLYHYVNRMISVMMIPLMKKLIHSIVQLDYERIRLYALAIVPQISACQPSVAASLMSKLYHNQFEDTSRLEVILMLQRSYDCLGFTCDDIGAYQTNVIPKCADPPADLPLVGYHPATSGYIPHPSIRDMAKIDLDMLQIKILTMVGAYSAALELYEFGKNSIIKIDEPQYQTVRDMATSMSRDKADPFFRYFVQYNKSPNYAHDVITKALSRTGKYAYMENPQICAYVVQTMQYQVVYMYAIGLFYESHTLCLDSEATALDIRFTWDKAVAMLIGSIEGHEVGGAPLEDGMMFYNLANEMCEQFNTCDENGLAKINHSIIQSLQEGQQAAIKRKCQEMSLAAYVMSHIVTVPIMQGVIRYAITNDVSVSHTDLSLVNTVKGEVFATSIIPIAKMYNSEMADVLERNMVIASGDRPVIDGAESVVAAIRVTGEKMGISCAQIGKVGEPENIDVCTPKYRSYYSGAQKASVTGTFMLAFVMAFLIIA